MTSASAGHIILTPTQPVGSGRSQRGSNPGPPHQESRALPTELNPPPPPPLKKARQGKTSQSKFAINFVFRTTYMHIEQLRQVTEV